MGGRGEEGGCKVPSKLKGLINVSNDSTLKNTSSISISNSVISSHSCKSPDCNSSKPRPTPPPRLRISRTGVDKPLPYVS